MNTPQNFSGSDDGGGGVKYAVARWVRRMGGCDIIWVRDGKKDVWVSGPRRGEGCRTWRVSVYGSSRNSRLMRKCKQDG